jgi:hypothetical protein
MNQYLRVTLNPLVKFLVRSRCVVDVDLMRNHEAWLGLPRDNHVSQIPIVGLHIALPGPN